MRKAKWLEIIFTPIDAEQNGLSFKYKILIKLYSKLKTVGQKLEKTYRKTLDPVVPAPGNGDEPELCQTKW